MEAPLLTFIPDLVEEHFDELQFLWAQRRRALTSASYFERQMAGLEERIAGHLDGVLIAGERLLDFVGPALAGEEELPAFAAAFSLIASPTAGGSRRVLDEFVTAVPKKLPGLRDALAHGRAADLEAHLTSVYMSDNPLLAAAAGEVLAFHGSAAPTGPDFQRFVRAEELGARVSGWRLAAHWGMSIPSDWYDVGFADDDTSVRHAVSVAGAWTNAPAFVAQARTLAAKPTPEAFEILRVFAAAAEPSDFHNVAAIAGVPAPDRFRVVGAFGHPYFVDMLLAEMGNSDPATALAAAAAFQKMTGRDVESNTRVKISPDGKPPADDFEAEFQDEAFLPDPELARKHWQELAPTLARSQRICRGMDVSRPLSREQFAALDMESRWEYCLRMRLRGGWRGTPLALERFPQPF